MTLLSKRLLNSFSRMEDSPTDKFLQDLAGVAQDFERQNLVAEAASLDTALLKQIPENLPGLQRSLQRRLDALTGQGDFGEQAEVFLSQLVSAGTEPTALGAMASAQLSFGLSRLGLLRWLPRSPLGKILSSRGPQLIAANLGAFGLEGLAFVGSSHGLQHLLNRTSTAKENHFVQELGHAYLTLGLLKSFGFLAGAHLRGISAGRLQHLALPQAAMFTGIYLSNAMAPFLNLGKAMDHHTMLIQSLFTLAHFNMAGAALNALPGLATANGRILWETGQTLSSFTNPQEVGVAMAANGHGIPMVIPKEKTKPIEILMAESMDPGLKSSMPSPRSLSTFPSAPYTRKAGEIRLAPSTANGFWVGNLSNTDVLPFERLFVPAFHRWIERALDPKQSNLELLENYQRLARILEVSHTSEFMHHVFEVQTALYQDFARSFDRLRRIQEASPQAVSKQEVRGMHRLVGEIARLRAEYQFEAAIIPHLKQSGNWDIPLKIAKPQILRMFRDFQDNPLIEMLIERGPSILAPLDLDFEGLNPITGNFVDALMTAQGNSEADLLVSKNYPISKRFGRLLEDEDHPVKVGKVDLSHVLSQWASLDLKPGELWVDLGSGMGANLVQLAHSFPQARFVGTEYFSDHSYLFLKEKYRDWPHLKHMPDNARFVTVGLPVRGDSPPIEQIRLSKREMRRPKEEMMREKLPKSISRGSAGYVSHFFPQFGSRFTREDLGNFNPFSQTLDPMDTLIGDRTLALDHQLETGLELLRPGGLGLFLTENPGAYDRAVRLLADKPDKVEEVYFTDRPFTGKQLVSLEITPRTIYMVEVNPSTFYQEGTLQRFGTFNWAYPLIYRRR